MNSYALHYKLCSTDPVAMSHVREEIASSILLVVDFGGWYRVDSKAANGNTSDHMIQHTQVSLLKDVIVPYTHLLPRLDISQNQKRKTLLYFKGAKHRHRVCSCSSTFHHTFNFHIPTLSSAKIGLFRGV